MSRMADRAAPRGGTMPGPWSPATQSPAPTLPSRSPRSSASARPPPPDLVASAIEGHSSPGDVVVDLHGRGGWVARAAVDRQRRAVSMESNPLTRLLAEIVLRPPDVRHLDAAFQALGAAPRGQSSLRVSIGDTFATRCPTCGRSAVVDEFIWEAQGEGDDDTDLGPRRRRRRRGGRCRPRTTAAAAAVDVPALGAARSPRPQALPLHRLPRPARRRRAAPRAGRRGRPGPGRIDPSARPRLAPPPRALPDARWPRPARRPAARPPLAAPARRPPGDPRPDRHATCDRRPSRPPCGSSLLHALLPASRLNGFPGRIANVRIHGGRVKLPAGDQWRERNPWLAFEDGYRVVRGFVQRLEGNAFGPAPARLGDDVRSLGEGVATAVVRLGTPSAFRSLETEAREVAGSTAPRRASASSSASHRSGRTRTGSRTPTSPPAGSSGREAAALLPLESLFGAGGRAPWGWQAAALGRSLAAVEPWLARDARVVLFLEAGRAGGARRGGPRWRPGRLPARRRPARRARRRGRRHRRVHPARRHARAAAADPGQHRPRPRRPAAPATRTTCPGRGLFAAPERFDRRPFSRRRGRRDRRGHRRRDPPGSRRAGPPGAAPR